MTTKPHVSDWGTPLTIEIFQTGGCVLDVSSASPLSIIFIDPNGSELVKEASFVTDGTDGKIRYYFEEDLIDTAGEWSYQASASFINGSWKSDVLGFIVLPNT